MSATVTRSLSVPRPCGDCGMCCKLPEIAELKKPAGVWCPSFKTGRGCTIYSDRPQVCRSFQCVWTLDSQLTEEWRPDRAKFVLKQLEFRLIVLTDPQFPDAWRRQPYFSQIKSWSYKRTSRFHWVLVHSRGHVIIVFAETEIDIGIERTDVRMEAGYRIENGRNVPYAYYGTEPVRKAP